MVNQSPWWCEGCSVYWKAERTDHVCLRKNSPFQNHSLVFLITTMKSFQNKDEENKITHKMLTLPRFTNLTSKALQPIKTKGGNTVLLGYSTVTRTAGGVEHEPLQQQESCPVTGRARLPSTPAFFLSPADCREGAPLWLSPGLLSSVRNTASN